jgi:hypothetical protein
MSIQVPHPPQQLARFVNPSRSHHSSHHLSHHSNDEGSELGVYPSSGSQPFGAVGLMVGQDRSDDVR